MATEAELQVRLLQQNAKRQEQQQESATTNTKTTPPQPPTTRQLIHMLDSSFRLLPPFILLSLLWPCCSLKLLYSSGGGGPRIDGARSEQWGTKEGCRSCHFTVLPPLHQEDTGQRLDQESVQSQESVRIMERLSHACINTDT